MPTPGSLSLRPLSKSPLSKSPLPTTTRKIRCLPPIRLLPPSQEGPIRIATYYMWRALILTLCTFLLFCLGVSLLYIGQIVKAAKSYPRLVLILILIEPIPCLLLAFRAGPRCDEQSIDLFVFDVLRLVRSKILSQGLNTCPMFLRHSGEQAAQNIELVVVLGLLVT